MMVFRRKLWVRILIFYLLCSNPIETRKQIGLSTKGQSEPLVEALLEEYGQVKRYSPSVYEEQYEPLHTEWSTDNDNDDTWDDDLHWSLDDSMVQEFDDELDDYHKYADEVDFFDRELYRISELDRQLKKSQQLDRDEVKSRPVPRSGSTSKYEKGKENAWEPFDKKAVKPDEKKSIKPKTATSATNVGKKLIQKKIEADDVGFGILNDITDMFDFVLETLTTVTEHITSTAKELLKYVMERGKDLFTYLPDDGLGFIRSWNLDFTNKVAVFKDSVMNSGRNIMNTVTTGLSDFTECYAKDVLYQTMENLFVYIQEATTSCLSAMAGTVSLGISHTTGFIGSKANTGLAMILTAPHLLLDFISSFWNSEFVLILNEEMIEPIHRSLAEIYYGCLCPLLDYITNAVFHSVSSMLNTTSRVVLMYAIKMKKVNDKAIVVTSFLINNGLYFVNRCNTKECLLVTIQSFVQDEKVFYKLVWLIMYFILTLLFLYYSYVSNKVTLQFCIFLLKVILKRIICMLYCIFHCCKKPPKLVDSSTYCDISNVKVRVPENYYKKLIEASEKKIQQLKQIQELATELEPQRTNMAGYLEMYEKQGDCDELEAQTAIKNEFVDTENLSLL